MENYDWILVSPIFVLCFLLNMHLLSIDSLQYFLGVASVGALFVRCPETACLQQGVWPPVQHHGGGRCGNDSHCITYPGLDVVVPFVIWHGDKPWERERDGVRWEEGRRRSRTKYGKRWKGASERQKSVEKREGEYKWASRGTVQWKIARGGKDKQKLEHFWGGWRAAKHWDKIKSAIFVLLYIFYNLL